MQETYCTCKARAITSEAATAHGRDRDALAHSAVEYLSTREDRVHRRQFDKGSRAVIKRDPIHRRWVAFIR
jgi:hypothetical protein